MEAGCPVGGARGDRDLEIGDCIVVTPKNSGRLADPQLDRTEVGDATRAARDVFACVPPQPFVQRREVAVLTQRDRGQDAVDPYEKRGVRCGGPVARRAEGPVYRGRIASTLERGHHDDGRKHLHGTGGERVGQRFAVSKPDLGRELRCEARMEADVHRLADPDDAAEWIARRGHEGRSLVGKPERILVPCLGLRQRRVGSEKLPFRHDVAAVSAGDSRRGELLTGAGEVAALQRDIDKPQPCPCRLGRVAQLGGDLEELVGELLSPVDAVGSRGVQLLRVQGNGESAVVRTVVREVSQSVAGEVRRGQVAEVVADVGQPRGHAHPQGWLDPWLCRERLLAEPPQLDVDLGDKCRLDRERRLRLQVGASELDRQCRRVATGGDGSCNVRRAIQRSRETQQELTPVNPVNRITTDIQGAAAQPGRIVVRRLPESRFSSTGNPAGGGLAVVADGSGGPVGGELEQVGIDAIGVDRANRIGNAGMQPNPVARRERIKNGVVSRRVDEAMPIRTTVELDETALGHGCEHVEAVERGLVESTGEHVDVEAAPDHRSRTEERGVLR